MSHAGVRVIALAVGLSVLLLVGTAGAATADSPDEIDAQLGPRAVPGPLYYVALGDSYSSGEGEPYVDPTELRDRYGIDSLGQQPSCGTYTPGGMPSANNPGGRPLCAVSDEEIEDDLGWLGDTGTQGNGCHRSAHAYPARVWGMLDAEHTDWGVSFAACSGAEVSAYDEKFKGEQPQKDVFAGRGANLVTTGFGGNDVSFAPIVEDCVLDPWYELADKVPSYGGPRGEINTSCRDEWTPKLPSRIATLERSLEGMYRDIVGDGTAEHPGHLADDGARVLAIGYPRPFPDIPPKECGLGNNSWNGADRETMLWLNSVADQINGAIRTAAANNGRVDYVDVSSVLSTPTDGVRHDLCVDDGGDRWINRLIPSDRQRSMHPKFGYHDRVAVLVMECWRDRSRCSSA